MQPPEATFADLPGRASTSGAGASDPRPDVDLPVVGRDEQHGAGREYVDTSPTSRSTIRSSAS